jgi:hypothetical protein
MSNSAHQRQVEDLKKAGINPILSASLGGASSPGGAMASLKNPTEGIANSAVALKKLSAETDYIKAMTEQSKGKIKIPGLGEMTLAEAERRGIKRTPGQGKGLLKTLQDIAKGIPSDVSSAVHRQQQEINIKNLERRLSYRRS